MIEDIRFPIGKFDRSNECAPEMRAEFIGTIERLPVILRKAVEGLKDEHLDTPYRAGGWSVRQLIHHMAESHLNAFCRVKLGLSEDTPTIKTYDEAAWAEMSDSKNAPIELSLKILDGIQARWAMLLKSMTDADYARKINHPELGTMTLDTLLALYDWHSRHHTAHITKLREKNGW